MAYKVIILYQLYMPSYFLGTFTEYPYNNKEELCTKALCTYFTFSQEKAKEEMHFLNCEVEQDEIIPLI